MAKAIMGREGRVSIGGTPIFVDEWDSEGDADDVEYGDFESPMRRHGTGSRGRSLTVKGYFNRDDNPIAQGIREGNELTDVKAFLIKNGLVFTFTTMQVLRVRIGQTRKTKTELEFSGVCDGDYTLPGGTLGSA